MRAGLAVGMIVAAGLAGCIGGSEDPRAAAAPQTADEELGAASTPPATAPPSAPAEDALAPIEGTSAAVPATTAPDQCALPVHGLDDPCIADGFHLGEAVYWDGGALPDITQTGIGPAACDGTAPCLELQFDVAETAPGARLRVDVQVYFSDPSYVRPLADNLLWGGFETGLTLELYAPGADPSDGAPAASASTIGTFAASLFAGGYDPDTREALDGPAVGMWTLRSSGFLPGDQQFRMRAKLEPPAPPADALAYPDLRIIPPFEVGFMVPTTTFQPGVPLPGGAPLVTCMAEEYAEAQANGLARPTMCLRFSMGFFNAGDGAMRLKLLEPDARGPHILYQEAGLEDLPMVQSVCTTDGRACLELPTNGGLVTRWHSTHLHYHYQNAYVFDLYRVVDPDAAQPRLAHYSTSGKLGIDPAPEAIEGWGRFYQLSPRTPVGHDWHGDEDPADKQLPAGWGDVYDWNRAGNYIDFPVDVAGRPVPGDYVIRGVTDPDGEIAETDEDNNWSYAYFRLTDPGVVEMLERGYGLDPWDAGKVVFDVTP